MNSDSDVNHSCAEVSTLMNEKKILDRRTRDLEEENRRFAADHAAQVKKFVDLESMCKTLKIKILKVTEDLMTETKKVADLEGKINTLEGNATLMTSVLARQSNKIVDLESRNEIFQGNVIKANADLIVKTSEVADLETKNMTLEDNITKATTDLAARDNTISDLESMIRTLQGNAKTMSDCSAQNSTISILKSIIRKLIGSEPWMNQNDDYETQGDWVGVEALKALPMNVKSISFLASDKMPVGLTNISGEYFVRATFNGENHLFYRIIDLQSSYHSIVYKARFSPESWFLLVFGSAKYVVRLE